jgi:hypothetical protein
MSDIDVLYGAAAAAAGGLRRRADASKPPPGKPAHQVASPTACSGLLANQTLGASPRRKHRVRRLASGHAVVHGADHARGDDDGMRGWP